MTEKKGGKTKVGKKSIHPILDAQRSLSQKASDKFTHWVGSWTFIFFSFLIIFIWVAFNIYGWVNQWDPYPFILLNLFLSILAALQAPIIMMSQNRQSERDRTRSEYDYSVNRKAEREIREIRKLIEKLHRKRYR